jgi:tetratricopeptide (TPR) repeat protein
MSRAFSQASLAERCYASAYQALETGDALDAERLFALMAILLPRDERPWIGLASARERRADWQAAAGLYRIGSVLVPSSAWCRLGRARALRRLGRPAEAECSLDQAEELAESQTLLAAIAQERNLA